MKLLNEFGLKLKPALALCASGMFAIGCVSTDAARLNPQHGSNSPGAGTVITDYARHVLSQKTREDKLTALTELLGRLVGEERDDAHFDRERMSLDLLFHDDAVLTLLRVLSVDKPEHEMARNYLLCFIGDASDFEKNDPQTTFRSKPLVNAQPVFPDLMNAIGAIRNHLNLPEEHFRVTGMYANKKLTKACVKLVIGAGAFNSEGWGLMFHRQPNGWELVWSRFEWIS